MKKFFRSGVIIGIIAMLLTAHFSFAMITEDTRVPSANELLQDSVNRWGNYWDTSINKSISHFFDFGSYSEADMNRLITIILIFSCIANVTIVSALIKYIKREEENIYTVVDTSYVRYTMNYLKNPIRSKKIAALIKKKDKSFERKRFVANVKKTFVAMENALSERNMKALKSRETQELFEKHSTQLQRATHINQLEKKEAVKVKYVEFSRYFTYHENENIVVIVSSSCIKYTINEKNGRVVKGNKVERKKEYYKLTFIRQIPSAKKQETSSMEECPYCSAPLNGAVDKCDYCGSSLASYQDWTLNEVECLSDLEEMGE